MQRKAAKISELRQVRLPRHRLRSLAAGLLSLHRTPPQPSLSAHPITVVCISDTHGTQPPLPTGDLLLHAGDLTQWGTFTEIQAQLTWLAQQPHEHKVLIAGNHDLLLDQEFKSQHPERWEQAVDAATSTEGDKDEELKKIKNALDWGGIHYLQESTIQLAFDRSREPRSLTVYGSPRTPRHGCSAFQHLVDEDIWTETVPNDTDIVLTHGPPHGHLDGMKRSGCGFLAREIARVRPRLVVFGHIHVGYGVQEQIFDEVGGAYESILRGWGGWDDVMRMAAGVLCGRFIPRMWRAKVRRTAFVNASVVEGWEKYRVKNEPVVLKI